MEARLIKSAVCNCIPDRDAALEMQHVVAMLVLCQEQQHQTMLLVLVSAVANRS